MKSTFKKLVLAAMVALAFPVGMALAGGNELAYFKVSALTTLAPTAVASGDYVPLYDASAGVVKKVDAYQLRGWGPKTVTLAVTTPLTQATHEGRMLLLNGAGGARTMTLPAATGSGDTYTFTVAAVNTSNYIITRAGSDVIKGGLVFASDNASNAELGFETTSATTITLNGTTTGGAAVGDNLKLIDIAAGVWAVSGQVTESGSEATPFS